MRTEISVSSSITSKLSDALEKSDFLKIKDISLNCDSNGMFMVCNNDKDSAVWSYLDSEIRKSHPNLEFDEVEVGIFDDKDKFIVRVYNTKKNKITTIFTTSTTRIANSGFWSMIFHDMIVCSLSLSIPLIIFFNK